MRSMGRGEGVSEGVDGGEGVDGVGRSMLGGEGVHVRWGSIYVGDRGSREIHAGRGRGPCTLEREYGDHAGRGSLS